MPRAPLGRRPRAAAVSALVATITLAALPLLAPARAATVPSWAAIDEISGTAGTWTGGVQIAPTFPAATLTSTSRAGGVGRISGASTWISASTPPGQVYGSSRDQPYLSFRPAQDTPTTPSVTTYTFASPTPPGGWAVVLGDVDADAVRISATGPGGVPLTTAQLGFRGVFNACSDTSPGGPSCQGLGDVPTWDPTTATLTGNAAAADTAGASGWLQPTVAVSTLTLTFTQRSGLPTYQTWFAALLRDVRGTVTNDGSPVGGVTVRLLDTNGTVVATASTGPAGTYTFPGHAAAAGYAVEIVPPPGTVPDEDAGAAGTTRRAADLSTADAVVDFALRDVEPATVSGTVRDTTGAGVPGTAVTLTPSDGGPPLVTTTDADGAFDLDPPGPGTYTWTVEPPPGYGPVLSIPDPVVVPDDPAEQGPLPGQDVVVALLHAISGTVTSSTGPVAGAVVSAVGPDGSELSAVTGTDGTYRFGGLPDGTWTVTVAPPAGYVPDGPTSEVVALAGDDVADVDFALDVEVVVPPTEPPTGPPTGSPSDPAPSPTATATATATNVSPGAVGSASPSTAEPSNPGPSTTDDALPRTGTDLAGLMAATTALLAGGVLLVLVRRRRADR